MRRAEGIPENVAFEQARRYAREIVPSFSATVYFGFATRAARWLSRTFYAVRLGPVDAKIAGIDAHGDRGLRDEPSQSNMDYVLVTWLAARPLGAVLCGGGMGAGLAAVGADPGDGGVFHPAQARAPRSIAGCWRAMCRWRRATGRRRRSFPKAG